MRKTLNNLYVNIYMPMYIVNIVVGTATMYIGIAPVK